MATERQGGHSRALARAMTDARSGAESPFLGRLHVCRVHPAGRSGSPARCGSILGRLPRAHSHGRRERPLPVLPLPRGSRQNPPCGDSANDSGGGAGGGVRGRGRFRAQDPLRGAGGRREVSGRAFRVLQLFSRRRDSSVAGRACAACRAPRSRPSVPRPPRSRASVSDLSTRLHSSRSAQSTQRAASRQPWSSAARQPLLAARPRLVRRPLRVTRPMPLTRGPQAPLSPNPSCAAALT